MEQQGQVYMPDEIIPLPETLRCFRWVEELKTYMQLPANLGAPPGRSSLTLIEGCAGGCTATYIMKDIEEHLGIPFTTTAVMEKDHVKRRYILRNHGPNIDHIYSDAGVFLDNASDRTCHLHNSKECHKGIVQEDLFCCGPPCQPYSRLSSIKRKQLADRVNPFETANGEAFVSCAMHIRSRRPRAVLLEEVESIFDKFDAGGKGEGDSPTCDPFFLNYKASIRSVSAASSQLRRYKGCQVHQIDDYLPMYWPGYGKEIYHHIFCPITDHKVLFALVEKAFAKMCGSYANLKSGMCYTAWAHLTGCCECEQFRTSREKPLHWVVTAEKGIAVRGRAERCSPRLGRLRSGARFEEVERSFSWIKFKKLEGDGPDEGYLFYYEHGQRVAQRSTPLKIQKIEYQIVDNPRDDDVEHSDAFKVISTVDMDLEEYWKTLLAYDQANYLMGTHMTDLNDEMPCGLVPGHAYSVLSVVEVEGLRLVRCRNPWGNTEWNGPWSDRCDEWMANPTIAEALNVDLQYEGSFWMDFEDWVYIMGEMRVTKKSMPGKRGALDIPVLDD